MVRIYIAGPYSSPDQAVNVKNAIDAAEQLAAKGYAPFIPHLTHFWHMIHPHEYNFWMNQDLEWLTTCEALLRLPGISKGASAEERVAHAIGIPVYNSIEEVPFVGT